MRYVARRKFLYKGKEYHWGDPITSYDIADGVAETKFLELRWIQPERKPEFQMTDEEKALVEKARAGTEPMTDEEKQGLKDVIRRKKEFANAT